MSNITDHVQALEALITQFDKSVPPEVIQNVTALLSEMGTPIEGIGDEPVAWKPGFLKLVQGTSDRGSLPKGAAIGDFVLGEKKLEQPLKFIPLRIWDSRQRWDPDQTSSKVLCRSMDAKIGTDGQECRTCPYQVWKEGEGTDCTKSKSLIAITSDLSHIFNVNFSKSNYKIGMELEGLMKRAAVLPYFRIWGLGSQTSSTAKNVENFKIEVLDEKSRKTPEGYVPFLKELFSMIGNDRKATVEAFYKNAMDRKQLLLTQSTDAPQLEHSPSGEVAEVKVETEVSEISPLAKGYSI